MDCGSVVYPQVTRAMDNSTPKVVVVAPDDEARHVNIAAHIGEIQNLWDDRALIMPVAYYAATYLNPRSIVFDICDGGGIFAVTNVQWGWRAQCIGALWSREAVRATHDGSLWRACGLAAMEANELVVLDAITAIDNHLARRLNERMGMTLRGFIPRSLCYNGVWKTAAWYEIDRLALDVGVTNGRSTRERNPTSDPGVRVSN